MNKFTGLVLSCLMCAMLSGQATVVESLPNTVDTDEF